MGPVELDTGHGRPLDAGHRTFGVPYVHPRQRATASYRRALLGRRHAHGDVHVRGAFEARRDRQVGAIRRQLGTLRHHAEIGREGIEAHPTRDLDVTATRGAQGHAHTEGAAHGPAAAGHAGVDAGDREQRHRRDGLVAPRHPAVPHGHLVDLEAEPRSRRGNRPVAARGRRFRRGRRRCGESGQRKVTAAITRERAAGTAEQHALDDQSSGPAQLEALRLDSPDAEQLLVPVGHCQPVDGERALHAGRHIGGQRLVQPQVGFGDAAHAGRQRYELGPGPQLEVAQARSWLAAGGGWTVPETASEPPPGTLLSRSSRPGVRTGHVKSDTRARNVDTG